MNSTVCSCNYSLDQFYSIFVQPIIFFLFFFKFEHKTMYIYFFIRIGRCHIAPGIRGFTVLGSNPGCVSGDPDLSRSMAAKIITWAQKFFNSNAETCVTSSYLGWRIEMR